MLSLLDSFCLVTRTELVYVCVRVCVCVRACGERVFERASVFVCVCACAPVTHV